MTNRQATPHRFVERSRGEERGQGVVDRQTRHRDARVSAAARQPHDSAKTLEQQPRPLAGEDRRRRGSTHSRTKRGWPVLRTSYLTTWPLCSHPSQHTHSMRSMEHRECHATTHLAGGQEHWLAGNPLDALNVRRNCHSAHTTYQTDPPRNMG